MAAEYDRSKDAQGWRGPEVVFGLVYAFVNPGESVLDIGIGTGLGSMLFHKAGLHVYGMDMSPQMLEVCAQKGFTEDLKIHDLTVEPYPYPAASLDHAVCVGVMNHFEDLGAVFRETSRILKDNGIFAFVVADRSAGEESSFEVEHADSRTTMFRHSSEQIGSLLHETCFSLLRDLDFSVHGHNETSRPLHLKAYAAKRQKRIEPGAARAKSRR
jgi:ubiquinone/menaquinone biosynthesis C-methylase UbiE